MKAATPIILITLICALAGFQAGCKKDFNIRDVDPGKAGRVRSLSPESQDLVEVADTMLRSLLNNSEIAETDDAPVIHMLPMTNNTRYNFNQEVFTSLLKAELNKKADGRFAFRSGDTMDEVFEEREKKREGEADYDPERRTQVTAGADYFLKGRVDGLTNVSTEGQAETMVYGFKLVDAESGLEVWEDVVMTKKEGQDDIIYR